MNFCGQSGKRERIIPTRIWFGLPRIRRPLVFTLMWRTRCSAPREAIRARRSMTICGVQVSRCWKRTASLSGVSMKALQWRRGIMPVRSGSWESIFQGSMWSTEVPETGFWCSSSATPWIWRSMREWPMPRSPAICWHSCMLRARWRRWSRCGSSQRSPLNWRCMSRSRGRGGERNLQGIKYWSPVNQSKNKGGKTCLRKW